jgi:hypothetical protein
VDFGTGLLRHLSWFDGHRRRWHDGFVVVIETVTLAVMACVADDVSVWVEEKG